MDLETRYLSVEEMGDAGFSIEARVKGRPTLKGYAARFNSLSHDLGGFRERLLPGAFDAVLEKPRNPVFALFNHDKDHVLGSTGSGTLSLRQDERGLFFEVDLPDTTLGNDLAVLVRRGDVTGASFAFSVNPKDEERSGEGKSTIRTIRAVSGLFDVSIVTTPAYPQARVSLRWLDTLAAQPLEERAAAATAGLVLASARAATALAIARMNAHADAR